MTREKALKQKFHDAAKEAREELWARGVYGNENYYTPAMLSALRDMAKEEVYPDGNFGDMDCNIWSMFHMMKSHMMKTN